MSKAISSLVTKAPQLAEAFLTDAKPKFAEFMRYAKVELAPPTPGDIPKAFGGLGKIANSLRTGRYKTLTVKEAWLNTLIGTEIFLWFFVGEVIGKRNLVGYKV